MRTFLGFVIGCGAIGVGFCAHAQQVSPASQRALVVAQFAQELGLAEITNDRLQQELAKSQKDAEDWKAAFHAWCGTAPNCGRPEVSK